MKYVKIILALAVVVFLVALAGWSIYTNREQSSDTGENSDVSAQTSDEEAPMHVQYPNLPEDNRYVKEDFNQIMDRFETGTGIIFLGFKECPWCQKMSPILNEAAEAEDVPVHYLDIRRLHQDNEPAYQQLGTHLMPYLEEDGSPQVRISTPDISIVKNGEIIWRYEMDKVPDEERNPEDYWTSERREQAIKNFREQINLMKEG